MDEFFSDPEGLQAKSIKRPLKSPNGCVLAHSSPSGRFRPGKFADFLGLLDHVCTLLKINTTNGLYLCYPLQKPEPLYHIYNPFKKRSKFENLNFSISVITLLSNTDKNK